MQLHLIEDERFPTERKANAASKPTSIVPQMQDMAKYVFKLYQQKFSAYSDEMVSQFFIVPNVNLIFLLI